MQIDIFVKTIIALCGLTNLFLAIYVYFKNIKEKLNQWFFCFATLTSLWCFANFVSLIVKNLFWLRATYAISCLLVLSGVFFAFILSNQKPPKWFMLFLSVISTILFILSIFTPLLVTSIVSFADFGLKIVSGPLFYVWEVYFFIMVAIIIYVPINFLNTVDKKTKRQISFFLTGETIFALWGIFVTMVLPSLGINSFVNLDSPATLFMVGFTSYAMTNYGLFTINIKIVAENIVNTMNDLVIAINNEMKISFVNNKVVEISGLEEAQLIDSSISILIKDDFFSSNFTNVLKQLPLNNYRTKFIAKTQDQISVMANISVLKNENNEESGCVFVLRDMRQTDELLYNLETKNAELEKINKLMVDRELKMIELKKIVEQQKEELSRKN